MLNISKGNMYPFVSHTWNAVKGKCSHDCEYCYMKIFKQNPIRLDEKELNINLGNNNFIFVGSSTDMFAQDVPSEWITKTLAHCCKYGFSKYLFQTKNPQRMLDFYSLFPTFSTLACTLETNRYYSDFMGKAPLPLNRMASMLLIDDYPKMISIEPIMDFDHDLFMRWINKVKPDFVSIGADSKNHHLPEPAPEKVELLLKSLANITTVVIKDNLKRLRT